MLFPRKTSCESSLEMLFHSNSLPYLQCSIRAAAAGGCLIADLFRDRRLMGTVAGPEVCLYSRSRFLRSCDILTTSEVSQLFQGINNGSGSPYLTFTVQAVCFVVVVFYLPGYLGETSNTFLLSRLRCSRSPACCRVHGKAPPLRIFIGHSTAFILCGYGGRREAGSPQQRSGSSRRLSHQCLCILLQAVCLDVACHVFFVVCLFSSSSVAAKWR